MNFVAGLPPLAQHWVWTSVEMLAIVGGMLGVLPIVIWAERKVAAHIQFRPGPNRVGPFGLIQPAGLVQIHRLLEGREEFIHDQGLSTLRNEA